jgi:hypothetical protein
MKYLKTFENNKTSDTIITFYRRINVYKDDFKNLIEAVEFLKENDIDYEIVYSKENGYFAGQIRYILYAFIKLGDYLKRNILDGEDFLLDDSINRFSVKITDVNKVKEQLIRNGEWLKMEKDDFDAIINANKYNL